MKNWDKYGFASGLAGAMLVWISVSHSKHLLICK